MNPTVTLSIPKELAEEASGLVALDATARMNAVIRWSADNVNRREGPFAAGVFDLDSGRCVGAGVNRVLSSGHSVAHAEMMAILVAQASLGVVDLSKKGSMVLTSSAQPCSQCYGGIPWCGVSGLEYGADRADVEAVGFDEGPCPVDWREQLQARGIRVDGPLHREQAARVLRDYAAAGGTIYGRERA